LIHFYKRSKIQLTEQTMSGEKIGIDKLEKDLETAAQPRSTGVMESWRMREYIKGMSITMFASFLAWTGMVLGIIFILTAINLVFLPLVLELQNDTINYDVLRRIMYGVGFPTLFVSIGMFFFSFALWKTIVNKDMTRMKTLIKIGCYIMGGSELLVSAAVIIFSRGYMGSNYGYTSVYLLVIQVFMFIIFTIFDSLMIHGVRKFKPRLVNTYIIFKIVIFALSSLGTLLSIIMYVVILGNMAGLSILTVINQFLLYSFFYFYSNGFIVLHYNIMIGNNKEENSLNLYDYRGFIN